MVDGGSLRAIKIRGEERYIPELAYWKIERSRPVQKVVSRLKAVRESPDYQRRYPNGVDPSHQDSDDQEILEEIDFQYRAECLAEYDSHDIYAYDHEDSARARSFGTYLGIDRETFSARSGWTHKSDMHLQAERDRAMASVGGIIARTRADVKARRAKESAAMHERVARLPRPARPSPAVRRKRRSIGEVLGKTIGYILYGIFLLVALGVAGFIAAMVITAFK